MGIPFRMLSLFISSALISFQHHPLKHFPLVRNFFLLFSFASQLSSKSIESWILWIFIERRKIFPLPPLGPAVVEHFSPECVPGDRSCSAWPLFPHNLAPWIINSDFIFLGASASTVRRLPPEQTAARCTGDKFSRFCAEARWLHFGLGDADS